MNRRWTTALCAFGLAGALCAQSVPSEPAVPTNPSGRHLFPAGAQRAGTRTVTAPQGAETGYILHWTSYDGSEQSRYRIDVAHADVLDGMLRIEETTTNTVPISQGGFGFRLNATQEKTPAQFAALAGQSVTAFTHGVVGDGVQLVYNESYVSGGTTVPLRKRFYVSLVGRSLRIEASADGVLRSQWFSNYSGFFFGSSIFKTTGGAADPIKPVHVPYMDSIPVLRSNSGVYGSWFVDWNFSNATDLVETAAPPATIANGVASFSVGTKYGRNDQNLNGAGEILAPVEEVVYVTVTKRIYDTFPVIDGPKSPYHLLMSGKLVAMNPPRTNFYKVRDWVDFFAGSIFGGTGSGSPYPQMNARLGLDQWCVHKWDWSAEIFNLNDPHTLPIGPNWGSQAGLTALANACKDAGALFALYFLLGANDPGYISPSVVVDVAPGAQADAGDAQLLAGANPKYNAAHSTRKETKPAGSTLNHPQLGWDTSHNLENSINYTLAPGSNTGHPTEVLAPHLRDDLIRCIGAQIVGEYDPSMACLPEFQQGGNLGLAVSGVHLDALASVPGGADVDHRKNAGFNKTIKANVRAYLEMFEAGRDALRGPAFAENNHIRCNHFETYAAGVIDGTCRKIPIAWGQGGDPDLPSSGYLVVPDFELTRVMPKASAMYGMGWEGHFVFDVETDTGPTTPMVESFINGWHATTVTYGHSGYVGMNGLVCNNYWSHEDTIRTYALMHGLQKRMKSARAVEIRYVDASGALLDLDGALAANLDLTRPRIRIVYDNGLIVHANHRTNDPAPWSVSAHGAVYSLPPDGFVATMPDGFVAFSGLNDHDGNVATPEVRIDYANVPGEYAMVSEIDHPGQRFHTSVGGVPAVLPDGLPASFTSASAACPHPSPAGATIVRDDLNGDAVWANGSAVSKTPLPSGGPAIPTSIEVVPNDGTHLSVGRQRLGYVARAVYGVGPNAPRKDVTLLATWSTGDANVAKVNVSGCVRGVASGSTTVSASFGGFTASAPVTSSFFPVVESASATVVSAAGDPTAVVDFAVVTDVRCAAMIKYVPCGSTTENTVQLAADPSGKLHHFRKSGMTDPVVTWRAVVVDLTYALTTESSPASLTLLPLGMNETQYPTLFVVGASKTISAAFTTARSATSSFEYAVDGGAPASAPIAVSATTMHAGTLNVSAHPSGTVIVIRTKATDACGLTAYGLERTLTIP